MALPAELRLAINAAWKDKDLTTFDAIIKVAHIACKLQREACERHFDPSTPKTPLVVPSTED